MIEMNGVQLDLNMADADENERVTTALKNVSERISKIDTGASEADGIRMICREVFSCFNEIFGEGTDKKVFGNKTDLNTALSAFSQLVETVNESRENTARQVRGIIQKYSPNRAARRAKK